MSQTGIVFSNKYLDHNTGPGHPERADRLRAIYARLSESGLLKCCASIEPPNVDLTLVEHVHAGVYINRFKNACKQNQPTIDTPDCPICPISYDIARLAAGGVVAAVDQVMAGSIRNAFCPVRPPGHHSEFRLAMGFCFFNNIAIAAEQLRIAHDIKRIAILDWDVHHGNGTQHHFEADPNTLFISLHQHPHTLFPGTGFEWETGSGDGVGSTLNIPMMPNVGDDEYRQAFNEQVLPTTAAFEPDFILASIGFDAHRRDPLGQINLTANMYGWMAQSVRTLADSLCQGRFVTVLEGGYDLQAIADCTQAHIEALLANNAK